MDIKRTKIGKDIFFCAIKDARYKNNRITVNFITPLDERTVSLNAVIPNLIDKNNSEYPDKIKFSKKLNSLYGARIFSFVHVLGNSQIITACADFIDGKYAFDGEDMQLELSEILCDCVLSPVMVDGKFESEAFENEKKNLIDDIEADINDKRTYARNRENEIMFKGEPCGIHKLGTKATAEAVTAAKASEAYYNLLKTARIEIMFVGSGDSEAVKSVFEQRFGKIERTQTTEICPVNSVVKASPEYFTENIDVEQSVIVMGFKTDCEDKIANAMMNSVYGGTPTAKLFSNVREKMSLCYYCSSASNRFTRSMTVICGVQQQNIKKATEAILAQLEDVKNGNISESEIVETKLQLVNTYKSVSDNAAALENWVLIRILEDDLTLPEEMIEKVNQIDKDHIINSAKSMKLDTVYVLTRGEQAE